MYSFLIIKSFGLHRRNWNFPGVEGSVRPNNLKKCMKLNNLEFPVRGVGGGGRVLEKIPSMGEVWIFSGIRHCELIGKVGLISEEFQKL